MKISQFRALIKEEVRKALNESKTTRKTLKEGVIEDLQVEPKTIGVQWEEAENLMDYVKAKHKLGPKKYVAGEGGDVEIYKIGTTPYILVDEDGFGAIFKASDSAKVIAAIKDGSYFDWNESVTESVKRKLREVKTVHSTADFDEYEDFEANKALNIQGDNSIDFYLKGVEDKWEDGNEGQLGAIKDAGFKLTLLVKVEMEGLGPRFSGIEVYKVNGQPYVIVSEVEIESASLFKASDLPKVLKALGVN